MTRQIPQTVRAGQWSWDRYQGIAEIDLATETEKHGYHPLFNEPILAIVGNADQYYDSQKHIIKHPYDLVTIFVQGPHHLKNKFLDRDTELFQLLESQPHPYKNKAIEIPNYDGGKLSRKQLHEAIQSISEYVTPIKRSI